MNHHVLIKFKQKLMQAGGRRIRFEGHTFINCVRNKEELPEEFESNRSYADI